MKEITLKGKKVLNTFFDIPMKREVLPEVPKILISFKNQYDLLHYIVNENNEKSILINNKIINDENIKLLENEIQRKRNSYKQQDVKKNLLDKDNLITCNEIKQKLLDSMLQCKFCKKYVKLFYDKIRDNEQWTLDRVDNDKGHNNDNVEIVCLKCNLQRRRIDYDKFNFTKTFTLSKIE